MNSNQVLATDTTTTSPCPDLTTGVRVFLPLVMRQSSLLQSALEQGPGLPQSPRLPLDPKVVAPSLDRSVAYDIYEATRFLYTGSNPIQTGVTPNVIGARCVAVLRGSVTDRQGQPIAGVSITLKDHAEYGQTLSRADGAFDLAVNGGGPLIVEFNQTGYLMVQRTIKPEWRTFEELQPVVMTPLDANVTVIDPASSAPFQVARGSVVSDTDGSRQSTLLFAQGTAISMTLPGGRRAPLGPISVRATEYTVGESGREAMPGELPANSGYTYAVEFSVDQAQAGGATDVQFSKPVINYVENLIHAPVGAAVPTGYYDRVQGKWVAANNGRVIKILSITNNLADVDVTGDGLADTGAALTALGMTDAERQQLASLYLPGQELWRVPVDHFTPWDHNWPYGPPLNARSPQLPEFIWKDPNDPCRKQGSIIGCETQTLGESTPIVGTPFSLVYQSNRVPGWTSSMSIDIPIMPGQVPTNVMGISLEIFVAGRHFVKLWAAPGSSFTNTLPIITPNQTYHFVWDGLDAYGRPVQGRPIAKIYLMYIYPFVYYAADANFDQSFGQFGTNVIIGDGRTNCRYQGSYFYCGVFILQSTQVALGAWDARDVTGLGGWTLDIHHFYDPAEGVLHLGSGEDVRSDAFGPVYTVITRGLDYLGDFASAPDGTLYYNEVFLRRIYRIDARGVTTPFAGTGETGYPDGDGGLALNARLGDGVEALELGPDGSLYYSVNLSSYAWGIRRITPDGHIGLFAGAIFTGTEPDNGDGGPALQAKFDKIMDIKFGADGSLYLSQRKGYAGTYQYRIRKISPSGIVTTIAGGGNVPMTGSDYDNGLPATQFDIDLPYHLAIGPDGSVYIPHPTAHTVSRLTPDGMLRRFAGNGDGLPGVDRLATQAALGDPVNVTVDRDGLVNIRARYYSNDFIWRVGADGLAIRFAGIFGCGYAASPDGIPANQGCIFGESNGLELAPDGTLLVGNGREQIRRIAPPVATDTTAGNSIFMPSASGLELYEFSPLGRHLRTWNALTNAVVYAFNYDTANRLIGVTDGNGNVLHIERAADGKPIALVAPGGQRTTLGLDAHGYLSTITNPASETISATYSADGLMATLTEPKGGVHHFAYDGVGRLTRDEDPAGGVKTLTRTETLTSVVVTVTSGLGRSAVYATEVLTSGERLRTVTAPDHSQTTLFTDRAGAQRLTQPDGTITTVIYEPDPRWGMHAPIAASIGISLPSGVYEQIDHQRTVVLGNPKNWLSLVSLEDTTTLNGSISKTTYDAVTRQITTRSPLYQQTVTQLDALGRVISFLPDSVNNTLDPILFTYDAKGLLTKVQQGTRSTTYTYDAQYRPIGRRDASGALVGYSYDAIGRLTQITLPGGQIYRNGYDLNGNLVSLTMPSNALNAFGNTAGNLRNSYTPPGSAGAYHTTFDAEGYPTQQALPSNAILEIGYDGHFRANSQTSTEATRTLGWDTAGRLSSLSRTPTGGPTAGIAFAYDGALIQAMTVAGPTQAVVSYTLGSDLRLIGTQLTSGADVITIPLSRDYDGAVTNVGPFTFVRTGPAGSVAEIRDNTFGSGFTSPRTLNTLGDQIDRSLSIGGVTFYRNQLTLDNIGHITRRLATIGGTAHTTDYQYNLNGQLTKVTRDTVVIEQYGYDANGNRISKQVNGGAVQTAAYDPQDRLTSLGGVTYHFNADGNLAQRGADTFVYGWHGELLTATVGGAVVTYQYDALGRRVSRTANAGTRQYFYTDLANPYRVTAVRDEAGTLTTLYYDERNLLFALERGGTRYIVGSDQVGTPQVVMNTSGAVVKQVNYDSFGTLLNDSNPGFDLPIGFAGGLPDPVTQLVRFGLRDYDPAAGRWTARDPALFDGSPLNLYVYANNNPISLRDPSGLACVGGSTYEGVGGGGQFCLDDKGDASFCAEFGVGVGASVDVDFNGDAAADGGSMMGEVVGKFGPAKIGVGGELDLDCFNLKAEAKGQLGSLAGSIDSEGPHFKGVSTDTLKDFRPKELLDSAKDFAKAGATVEAKLAYRHCWSSR